MTSVVSSRQGRVYVAGAPRFNHTGKVILFSMHNNRSLTIHQALRGEQVMEGRLQGADCGQGLGSDPGRLGRGLFPLSKKVPNPQVFPSGVDTCLILSVVEDACKRNYYPNSHRACIGPSPQSQPNS